MAHGIVWISTGGTGTKLVSKNEPGSLEGVIESVERLMTVSRKVVAGKAPKEALERAIHNEMMRRTSAAHEEVLTARPGLMTNQDRIEVRVSYKQPDGFVLPMIWDFVPNMEGPGQNTVIGICPACYRLAPSHVDPRQRQAPVVVEQTMRFRKGNPDADSKTRIWSFTGHDVIVEWERARPLLSVGRIIKCLYHRSCSWAVRVERGKAHWVPVTLTRSLTK